MLGLEFGSLDRTDVLRAVGRKVLADGQIPGRSFAEECCRPGCSVAGRGAFEIGLDQPGHGASPRRFTITDTVHTLEAIAREVGPVDVFAGHSMAAINRLFLSKKPRIWVVAVAQVFKIFFISADQFNHFAKGAIIR